MHASILRREGYRKHGVTYSNHCIIITGTLLKLVAVVTIVIMETIKIRITLVSEPCVNIHSSEVCM